MEDSLRRNADGEAPTNTEVDFPHPSISPFRSSTSLPSAHDSTHLRSRAPVETQQGTLLSTSSPLHLVSAGTDSPLPTRMSREMENVEAEKEKGTNEKKENANCDQEKSPKRPSSDALTQASSASNVMLPNSGHRLNNATSQALEQQEVLSDLQSPPLHIPSSSHLASDGAAQQGNGNFGPDLNAYGLRDDDDEESDLDDQAQEAETEFINDYNSHSTAQFRRMIVCLTVVVLAVFYWMLNCLFFGTVGKS